MKKFLLQLLLNLRAPLDFLMWKAFSIYLEALALPPGLPTLRVLALFCSLSCYLIYIKRLRFALKSFSSRIVEFLYRGRE